MRSNAGYRFFLPMGGSTRIRLKRTDGLARCTWRGVDHFDTSIWSSVVASNLALFARLRPT
ncbi:hypothetical protein I6F07_31585 [Ensifer sp. IC4062]|nr:hypothetical protein [Ensifer sp. IC4062]MCA1444640.1 hypothetical protein [Ensifer sp. IC4062]